MAGRKAASAQLLLAAAVVAVLFIGDGLSFVSGAVSKPRDTARTQMAAAPPGSGKPAYMFDPVSDRSIKSGIRTGLSDLLKPLNSEAGVTAKEDSYPTYFVMFFGIVMLFLFYFVLLLINNQSVLLPPEDEFDEYVANFIPYFLFGEGSQR
eukprot:TRINITY_DN16944_c0_g2_i1.p1 TRINITY_DN16944_c0_g2~~TRINITY_DN16944_c0_g2_i1.p1  ORF type:complete len:172 (-),score=40.31 TRINITY_DN16944_c0_g2_i1:182-634(-)